MRLGTTISTDVMDVLRFVREYVPVPAAEGMKGIGLRRDGEMVAGVLYENFNEQSIWTHIAAVPGRRWMTREYLRYIFHYPFNELGVQSILGWVNADNADARRFDEHLGFKVDAVLKEVGPGGVDVLIYRMKRDECRFIN